MIEANISKIQKRFSTETMVEMENKIEVLEEIVLVSLKYLDKNIGIAPKTQIHERMKLYFKKVNQQREIDTNKV